MAPSLARIARHCKLRWSSSRFSQSSSSCSILRAYSYAHGISDNPLSGLKVGDLLIQNARKNPERLAVISCHQKISKTYNELYQDSLKLAQVLQSLGVNRGDRVGIWAPNCYEWTLTHFATSLIGAVLVNVNPGYRASEFGRCINLVDCHTLIASQRFKTSKYYDMIEQVAPDIRSCRGTLRLNLERLPSLKNILMLSDEAEAAGGHFTRFDDEFKRANVDELQIPQLHFDDPINIQFTSGTTGAPKGATLTHHNIVNNSLSLSRRLFEGLDDSVEKILCLPNPLYHAFGCIMGTLAMAHLQGTVVLPDDFFNPITTMKAIQDHKCTVIYGTPTMMVDILANEPSKYKLDTLRRGIMAGSPCPTELVKALATTIPSLQFLIAYGLTEASPVITMTSINDSEELRFGTVGTTFEHVECAIFDSNTNQIVPHGTVGEVRSRGYSTFAGYWNDPVKTSEIMAANGWLRSGDLGSMDSNGYVSIIGRLKDMIIRGGENIYPTEIEEYLMSHSSIADIQVVGVPDKRMGEEICAFVRLKQGCTLTAQELKDFCKGSIAHYKIPKYVEFVDDYPRTVTGKVQKVQLREMAKEKFPQQ